jgi:hypothetical protein
MLYLSIGVMVEILAKSVVVWVQGRAPWPHRALLAILCLLNLVLVAGAMIVAPFRGRGSLGLLNASLGPGAYVAIVGALVGIVAAAMLLVTGPPALTR